MLKPILRWIGNISWLRLGIRRRIVSSFYPSDRSPSFPFDVLYYGTHYLGNINVWQEWHVYFFGGYELKEVALIRRLLSHLKSPVVLDVGANLGGHAVAMAPHALEVHAFEPFSPLADRAQILFDKSPYKNITLHRFGLADANGEKDYFFDVNSPNSGTGSFDSTHTDAPKVAKLALVKGDDWALERRVDFIKIDIEGFEAYALIGLRKTLEKSCPFVIMEITETSLRNIELVGGLDAIFPYEYSMYEVCNPKYSFGLFQTRAYRLQMLSRLVARRVSFNVVVVPTAKSALIEPIFM
jgi:FkbM family methyltransferase